MNKRIEEARAYLAKRKSLKRIGAWDFGVRFGLRYQEANRLLIRAQLDRGEITLADLTPDMRREMVDLRDLHAIANGPIMDSNEIYLPAGKLSMEETIAREQSQMLGPDA